MATEYWDSLTTSFGTVSFAVDTAGALVRLDLAGAVLTGIRDAHACADAHQQLAEYFARRRTRFDLATKPQGTDFQKRVWGALARIPYGQVTDYADIARTIGQPGAARAVGQANGANPIPIVIPCHRCVARDRSLGGFSSGLDLKRRLLALEGIELAA